MGAGVRRRHSRAIGGLTRAGVSVPLVSIALLTRNGGERLAATLDAIARQQTDFAFEVVAIDSSSTDATLPLLKRTTQRVVSIPPQAFNHGLTRNLAVEQSRGELVVLLVQDALPLSAHWLARLTAPLRADPDVAGAFCRQEPRPDASAITRHYLGNWIATSPAARTVRLTAPTDFELLDPRARLELCAFDNVCSCIRRSVWQRLPFREAPIAEDLEWSREVLMEGFRLSYVPDAVVEHSHDRPARYEFARTHLVHFRLARLFGLRTIPNVRRLAGAILASVRLHLACERRAAHEGRGALGIGRALALAVAWPLGQYTGALAAARGWKPLHFDNV
jgi:rhamnosyltransferase